MATIEGNDELVKTLIGLAATEKISLTDSFGKDHEYTTKPVYQAKADLPPQASSVEVTTLDGFVDLIKEKLEGIDNAAGKFIAQVVDHRTVQLKALVADEYGRRLSPILATPVKTDGFKFGTFINQEQFVIEVAAKFAEGGDKAYVLDLASSLTNEAVTTNNDNGFVQGAVVKRGVRMKEGVTLKPRVTLLPYRTFPEAGQPASEFVFRARTTEGEPPELMLIEADGGKWKVDAINELGRYLRSAGLEIPVIS